jgi:hypothetical protein
VMSRALTSRSIVAPERRMPTRSRTAPVWSLLDWTFATLFALEIAFPLLVLILHLPDPPPTGGGTLGYFILFPYLTLLFLFLVHEGIGLLARRPSSRLRRWNRILAVLAVATLIAAANLLSFVVQYTR